MNEFDSKYKDFLKESKHFLNGITDSSYYDLLDWYDYNFNPNSNDEDPACDAAYEFADYVWETYIHQIDYDKIGLYEFDIEIAKNAEICTKDLRKAKILCINEDDIIVSIKDFNAEEVILRYKKDGNPCDEKYDANEYGLCILKHKCTGYINLFDVAESGNIITSNVFVTEEEAKADIKKPEYYLDTIKIEFCR